MSMFRLLHRFLSHAPAFTDRVPAIVRDVLSSPGRPLDMATRSSIEPRSGHNFSNISIHPGSRPPIIVQPKLQINQPDDPYEREAEQISNEVMQTQKSPDAFLKQSPRAVQGRVMDAQAGLQEAPPLVEDVLRSSGRPLDPGTREFFESRLGHQFGGVRVHSDARAAESAQAVNALAYTVGQDIVFGPGRYAPATQTGRQLLAHELTHVVQQSGAAGIPPAQPRLVQRSIETYLKAMNQKPRDWYTAARHLNGESTKTIRARLKDLGDPRLIAELHKAAVNGPGVGPCSNVALLTEPDYLKVNPGAKPFDRTKCAPAPVPQKAEPQKQAGGAVDPLKRSANEIMADDKYIDNNIKRMEFYAAQEAHVFYEDGSKLELGLVPPYVKAPFEGVDYRTPSTSHIGVVSDEPGTFKYIPRGMEVKPPAGTKSSEVLDQLTRTVTFKVESASKRIVPTQVNTRTAPILCQMLMQSEKEYGKLMDETSKGGVKVFTAFKRVLEIYSFLPGGALAKAAATKSASASEGLLAKMVEKLSAVLSKGGAVEEIIVGGVSFGKVIVSRRGGTLAVEYTFIQNVGRVAGQGRAMQVALEQAAVQVAKEAGAKEAQVIVHTVVNQKWMAYLESLGYTKTIIDKAGQAGFEAVWMKVISIVK